MIDSDSDSSPSLVSPSRREGASARDASSPSSALVELLVLAEQWTALEEERLRLGTEIEQRQTGLRILQMSISQDERRLGVPTEPDPGHRESEKAIAEAKARRDQLTGELEAALRQSATARNRIQKDEISLRRDASAALDRLPPQQAVVYRKLTEAGIVWPIVRADAGLCGGCGVTVPASAAGDASVCRACGRLVVNATSSRPDLGH